MIPEQRRWHPERAIRGAALVVEEEPGLGKQRQPGPVPEPGQPLRVLCTRPWPRGGSGGGACVRLGDAGVTVKGEREGGRLLRRAEVACGGEAGPEAVERSGLLTQRPVGPPIRCLSRPSGSRALLGPPGSRGADL